LSKDGTYNVNEGDLTIHGITKKLTFPATLTVKGGKLSAASKFKLKVEDFNISIPGVVADKISKEVDVNVDCIYEPR
jgi:polyisoprenoid-binding protein YceI